MGGATVTAHIALPIMAIVMEDGIMATVINTAVSSVATKETVDGRYE